jgi:hypothetical protein
MQSSRMEVAPCRLRLPGRRRRNRHQHSRRGQHIHPRRSRQIGELPPQIGRAAENSSQIIPNKSANFSVENGPRDPLT